MNAAIAHPVAGVRKCQIFLFDRELLPSDIERHRRQLIDRRVRGEDVALLGVVVCSAGDGVVNGLARGIIDEREGSPGIRDGGVAGTIDRGAVNGRGSARKHPEALRVVDGGVVRGLAAESLLVDVAKGVERRSLVGVLGVVDRTEVSGEKLLVFGDVLLGDHVFDRGGYGVGGYGVDGAEGEAEETVAGALFELGGQGLGEFDGLGVNCETADSDVVGTDGAGC